MNRKNSKGRTLGVRVLSRILPFFLTAGIFSFSFASGSSTQPVLKGSDKKGSAKVLEFLKPEIEKLFKECVPKADIVVNGNRLTAHCDVKKLEMPLSEPKKGVARKGWSEPPGEVIPNTKGIILVVSVLPGNKSIIQKATGSFQEKYWNLLRQDYPIKGKREHFWVEMYSGKEVNINLIEKIKEILENTSKE